MAGAKNFKNMAALYKHLETQIADALQNEVAKEVVEVLTEDDGTVDRYVYDAYDSSYERTFQLKHPSNFNIEKTGKMKVKIYSTRSEGNRDIAKIIESGKGYYSRALDEKIKPRPFHAKTTKDLQADNSRLVRAMKDGLRKRGIKVV